ncbi:hypothetical protein GUJ93_ZPchr0002g25560 [Zizania palustris]|uniref:DUF7722 domain-containing protein n=1 Tax=Zizania palustris TaxID=103762 RepID=A0A8J5RQI5_ZIZPA|nr:hypothetical protein GUJ93_ZPchr0002g25560 [Zizania palustris]
MGSLGPSVVSSQTCSKATMATKTAVAPAPSDGGGCGGGFRMPLHYPRYRKEDYEAMPEWRVDCLLREYGLPVDGDLDDKRRFAMGAFLWPGQY